MYFALGIFIFNLGYLLTVKKEIRSEKTEPKSIFVNNKIIKIVIVIEVIVIVLNLITSLEYILNNMQYNFYFTLKSSTGTENIFISYFRSFTIAFTLFIVIAFLKADNFKNKNIILKIQVIIGLLNLFLTLGRTAILLCVLAIITIRIIYTNRSNKKIIYDLTIFGFLGLIIFSIYNIAKYPYLFESNSLMKVLSDTLFVYSSGSLVTFQKWADSGIQYLFGENTFRFIKALLIQVGYDTHIQDLLNQFTNISNQQTSNVYTFYYFYTKDFGLTYGLIIQFLVGMIHGFLYSKMLNKNPFWVYIFSLSLYPLFMQFFQDQYVSLTSTWIQYIFYGLILFKSGLFMKVKLFEQNNLLSSLNYNQGIAQEKSRKKNIST